MNELNPTFFWNNVRELAKNKNMSLVKLAEMLHISKQAIYAYIKKNSIPAFELTYSIAQILDVSLEYLCTGQEFSENTNITSEDILLKNRLNEIHDIAID